MPEAQFVSEELLRKRERNKLAKRRSRAANPEREKELNRVCNKKRYAANPAQWKSWNQRWNQANRGRKRALLNKRKEYIALATPTWVDHDAIARVYEECVTRTAQTGIPHHVDHIVPLRGKNVCGLHVHWNLRVTPARDNLTKSNRFIEDYEPPSTTAH